MPGTRKILSVLLGPSIFALMQLIGPPETMGMPAYQVLSVTVWVAIWWILEALPIAVTALLPIVLFPLLGALDIGPTTSSFGHKYVFLYLGGFIIALAIEKWNLHRRIALTIISLIGSSMVKVILGFMIATAFLSMWISNTATSVMMLPIAIAVVSQFKGDGVDMSHDAGKALMLGIAYSASIGGFSTLIGTPPNLVLAGVLEETYGVQISFLDWMKFGLPISVVLLVICWWYLSFRRFPIKTIEFPGGASAIRKLKGDLGPSSKEEKRVFWVFVLTAVLWITRSLIESVIPGIDDTIIAMGSGILLFLVPATDGKMLMEWDDCKKLPWDIILLFGGGLALAKGFSDTGLASWIASQLTQLEGVSLIVLILILVASVNFLTEITSNLATTAMLLPVLAPMAIALDLHPYMIMVSVTISASCAFMLPVATPPNAVVFGSGYLRIPDMIRSGFFMNLVSIVIITLVTYFLLPMLWNFNANVFPDAFK